MKVRRVGDKCWVTQCGGGQPSVHVDIRFEVAGGGPTPLRVESAEGVRLFREEDGLLHWRDSTDRRHPRCSSPGDLAAVKDGEESEVRVAYDAVLTRGGEEVGLYLLIAEETSWVPGNGPGGKEFYRWCTWAEGVDGGTPTGVGGRWVDGAKAAAREAWGEAIVFLSPTCA